MALQWQSLYTLCENNRISSNLVHYCHETPFVMELLMINYTKKRKWKNITLIILNTKRKRVTRCPFCPERAWLPVNYCYYFVSSLPFPNPKFPSVHIFLYSFRSFTTKANHPRPSGFAKGSVSFVAFVHPAIKGTALHVLKPPRLDRSACNGGEPVSGAEDVKVSCFI